MTTERAMTLSELRDELRITARNGARLEPQTCHYLADAIDAHLRAEPVAWFHNDFGQIELSRVQRLGWRPLYAAPPAQAQDADDGMCYCQEGVICPSCERRQARDADARLRSDALKRLQRVLEAAESVVSWDWSDNDSDAVADITRLFDAVQAARAAAYIRHDNAMAREGEHD